MAQNDASKRAASMLTIAQHKFKQALKKEDNHEPRLPPVAVELSAQFLSDLDAAFKQNTPVNVQKCTAWVIKHIASSRTRIVSLGDYLISYSKSIVVDQPASGAAARSAARGRFMPLLIINDVLHTDTYHQRSAAKNGIFGKESMLYIPELIELAATYTSEKDSLAEKKLRAILNYWAVNRLLGTDDIRTLRDQADEALLIAQGGTPVRKRNYLLPEYHGDRNAPWYDLPASYMLEQMVKNPNRPLDPRHIKVAKLDKKPVSAHVRQLLDNYFDNIDLKYVPTGDNPSGETKKYKLWLDPMGQLVKQNKETGKTDTVCNGYGWSVKLCQDMQRDGVPQSIKLAREEAQREEEMESLRPAPQQRRRSPSSRRRRSPSSDLDCRRGRGGRSHSRPSSRSSYDSRKASRSQNRTRSQSRRRTSPQPERRTSFDRGRSYEGRHQEQKRPPPKPFNGGSSGSGQQRNGQEASNRTQGMPNNSQYPPPPPVTQNFSQAPLLPFGAPPFPQPPHMPNQFPGQFPMHSFPPPPPFQPGAFPGGIPPPPPPNYSGPYPPPPPNVASMPGNPHSFSGNQYGSHAQGNNMGYGQGTGSGQSQGGFQGGRGGLRGGRGFNGSRGGQGGQQRGQRW